MSSKTSRLCSYCIRLFFFTAIIVYFIYFFFIKNAQCDACWMHIHVENACREEKSLDDRVFVSSKEELRGFTNREMSRFLFTHRRNLNRESSTQKFLKTSQCSFQQNICVKSPPVESVSECWRKYLMVVHWFQQC